MVHLLFDLPLILLSLLHQLIIRIRLGLNPIAILILSGEFSRIGYITIPNNHICLLLYHFLGVEEVVADEGRVDVIPVPLAFLEGTVEMRIKVLLAGFFVDVDCSEGGALGEVGTLVAVI